MKAALANLLWLAASWREARAFRRAASQVAETQANLLQTCLAKNHKTAYLASHAPIKNYQSLPLTTYEDYLPYIERIANGERNVLTHEPVLLFEPSSGSTAASKLIPYTRALNSEFSRGLSAWIHDLYRYCPSLMGGPAYWSISPLTEGRRHTPAGIPIGFEEDSAYLGAFGAVIEAALMAVPNQVKRITEMAAFRYVTLLHLLGCADLRLISVWNPTFLSLLLEPLPVWWDSLLNDIAGGTCSPPGQPPIPKYYPKNPRRARQLAKLEPTDYPAIWPRLALISCWGDGASKPYARALQAQFPGATLQPKGLLATEAFVSFPLTGQEGAALAVTSHFFEFQAESGNLLLAHQLQKGQAYAVIVTTGGGLYRYQLRDIVEVTGFYGQVPCLRFIGKADQVSDYFGEKLDERFVFNALAALFARLGLQPVFFLLAPEAGPPFHYCLYLELPESAAPSPALADEIDAALRANFHYDYCRRLGQLAEAQVQLVRNGSQAYIRACQQRGQKLGDIKAAVLQKSTGWGQWFINTSHPVH